MSVYSQLDKSISSLESMDWLENTKNILDEAKKDAKEKSVKELVRLVNNYSKLEEKLVELLLELQECNKALRDIIIEKKSISVTG